MTVDIDEGSNKKIKLTMDEMEIFLIPGLIQRVMELTRMYTEMGINEIIHPQNVKFSSNLSFKLSMTNSFIIIPNNTDVYIHPLVLRINNLNFEFRKTNLDFSEDLYASMSRFSKI